MAEIDKRSRRDWLSLGMVIFLVVALPVGALVISVARSKTTSSTPSFGAQPAPSLTSATNLINLCLSAKGLIGNAGPLASCNRPGRVGRVDDRAGRVAPFTR